jgi:hypothetical protein
MNYVRFYSIRMEEMGEKRNERKERRKKKGNDKKFRKQIKFYFLTDLTGRRIGECIAKFSLFVNIQM